jgi:hypothetical protein
LSAAAPLTLEVQDVRHSADSCRWYSPECIVEPARELLGGFDLDPASDEVANYAIRAARIFTIDDDGLVQPWSGRVFHNPPTPPRLFWEKLCREHAAGNVPSAVYTAYSFEQLQQSQGWAAETGLPHMLDFAVCIPRGRIRFRRTAADAIDAWHRAADRAEHRARSRGETWQPTRASRRELDALMQLAPTQLVPGDIPTHASAIVGLGVDRAAFAKAYGSLGWCSP